MHIENIPRISLPARWTPQDERDLPISHRVFGKIIVDDKHILALIHKILAHRTSGIRRDKRQRRRVRCPGYHYRRIFHRPRFAQFGHNARHLGFFLPGGYIDTDDILALLVDDGIDSDSCFSRLAIADDEFALSAADRDEGIDGLDAGLYRLIDRLAGNDAPGDFLYRVKCRCVDFSLAIDRHTERRKDAADDILSDWHGKDFPRAFDDHPFADIIRFSHKHHAHFPLFEILCHAECPVLEFHHFRRHHLRQSSHPCHAIAYFEHHSDSFRLRLMMKISNMLFQFLNERIGHNFYETYDLQLTTYNRYQQCFPCSWSSVVSRQFFVISSKQPSTFLIHLKSWHHRESPLSERPLRQ